MKILKACFTPHNTIMIHGDSDANLMKSLTGLQSIAMIIHNKTINANIFIQQRTKKDLYLMTVNSHKQLKYRLHAFKTSLWWNMMIPLFIVDESNNCNNARDFLKSTWSINLVVVYFLCYDNQQIPFVYTYNPYTNRASNSWKQVQQIQQYDNWTLYKRPLNKGKLLLLNLIVKLVELKKFYFTQQEIFVKVGILID